MNCKILSISITLLSMLYNASFSQKTGLDSVALNNTIKKSHEIYTAGIGVDSHLLNGVGYKDLNLHNDDEGHPFFLSDDWIEGSIVYDGSTYSKISIQYELFRDKIIIEHPYSFFKLELIQEKISSFTISGHTFVRLLDDTSKNPQVKTGIYDRLYDGHVKVYAKRKKNRQEVVDPRTFKYIFGEKNQYFIYKEGVYYPVKNKSSVMKVFKDRKAALKKYLSKNKIYFNKDRELALAQSAKFYEESEKQL